MAEVLEDKELVRRIADGDKAAMRLLYERHHDALFAFLRARGADQQEAADGLQDAMLAVWNSAGRYSGQSSVKTWIFTIARNKLIDQNRKTARLSFSDAIPDEPDTAPNPEMITVASNDADRVRACLGKLKPGYLTVIRLAFYDDRTYAEISEIEDIPEGTVKTRVHHAKKLLLRCLGRR